ncbi:hypothetical protein COW36_21745 [bacterium (Candidatus Blackallbacteria) CG17_big_fil_post_rev_8_21_14_2_50_48_46]|uniref:Porin n=1 Tax=bacterium (Candidatus Blackallbacteria) CG17_big_fil_post_rev_8_21_14_2_50_48_46 TaxID=2014261 RepID=A0A2M7FYH0_9BACT|nr:MAG: hypothetical protein COW64_11115 [bacterium (Candidatus Blackallbacteria) CG18_big_fil_WC_8_21_14_2_50_49_26]PIW14393.1 MAG: hypothetical protein COW36_21745 [bacterium (Candidatus Blackallbacteria) CG17_big_fil_post_rev_8_21_14_2_50_48_46]PIW46900.1 MAG: hypothetical protein COW20_14160 [bacterium (Candidatus Blackallbacteria) CG13_big_fil_rev_8_21_14_2_50_49_14]
MQKNLKKMSLSLSLSVLFLTAQAWALPAAQAADPLTAAAQAASDEEEPNLDDIEETPSTEEPTPEASSEPQLKLPDEKPTDPNAASIDEIDELLNSEIASGKTGSFGARLNELGVSTYLHGYAVIDANAELSPATFDMHYFNIFVGANIKDLLIAEIQLEKEHGGDDQQIRFGQLDIVASPLSIFRVGKFLVPIGSFNTYLYPEYINKMPDRPFAMQEVIPVSWGDVGVQVFGRYDFGIDQNINYALYAINGLHDATETSSDSDDAKLSSGSLRKMRNNHIDKNLDKGLGGRVGARLLPGLDLGFSAYTGATSNDGKLRTSIFDFDLNYEVGNFDFKGEYAMALQGTGSGNITKQGFYLQGAYKVFNWLEPVLRYDMINYSNSTAENKQRVSVGVNFYPFADTWSLFMLKTAYSYTLQENNQTPHSLIAQAAMGF